MARCLQDPGGPLRPGDAIRRLTRRPRVPVLFSGGSSVYAERQPDRTLRAVSERGRQSRQHVPLSNLAGFGATVTNGPRNFNLSETHLFGAALVNEARFGYGRSSPSFAPQAAVLGPRFIFSNGQVDQFGEATTCRSGASRIRFR